MFEILFCLLFSSVSWASVVKVTSVYPDESNTSRELKVSGSGFIFNYQNRQFVFTASHVSQGKNTQIYLGEVELPIKGRRLHVKSDLELFEVSGAPDKLISATYENDHIEFKEKISRKRWLDSHNYIPLLDWIYDPQNEIDNLFALSRQNVFELNATGNLLNADSLIQPGMSGSPLLSNTMAQFDARENLSGLSLDQTIVRGLAIRRDRFFARASFVPFAAMKALLKAYLTDQPVTKLKDWFAHGSILYRKAKIHREISGLSASMAGGTITDVGNGVSMDGGDLDKLNEDNPDSFLKKVSALMSTGNSPILSWSTPFPHPVKDEELRFETWFDMELYPMAPGGSILMGQAESNRPDLGLPLLARLGADYQYETNSPAFLRIDHQSIVFKIPLPENDRFDVELTRTGFFCLNQICREKFQPILEVTSLKGRSYIVDLREFFFFDMAGSKLENLGDLHGLSETEQKVQVYESVRKSLSHPRIIYRAKKSDSSAPLTVEQGQRQIIQW